MKPKGAYDFEYKGSEYMKIYPYLLIIMELRHTKMVAQLSKVIMFVFKERMVQIILHHLSIDLIENKEV